MEITALVGSIFSVLIAAGSLVYARRSVAAADRSADASEASADAARKSAWLQSEDDWRARTPSFEIEWDDVIGTQGNAKTYGATLRSYGPEPYESVFVRLLDPPSGEPKALQGLVDLQTHSSGEEVALGPVKAGQRLKFGVIPEFDSDGHRRGGVVDLQVTVQTMHEGSDFDEWTVPVQLQIHHPPRVL